MGIDLGTTNSVVAAVEAAVPTVVPNEEGERTTPSVGLFSALKGTRIGGGLQQGGRLGGHGGETPGNSSLKMLGRGPRPR